MLPVNLVLKEVEPKTQLQKIIKVLMTFRKTFFEKTSVKAKCNLPEKLEGIFGPAWGGHGDIEIRYCGPSVLSDDRCECVFQKADGSWAKCDLNEVVTLEDYERFIFSLWSYTDGKSLDAGCSDIHCRVNWLVDTEAAKVLDKIAQDIDELILPLSDFDNCQVNVNKIYNIIRNGNSQWMPNRVHWTYIKELDEVIRELELLCEQRAVDTKHQNIYQPPQTIPYEYRTSPITQTQLAELWGRDMTRKKIRQMIDTGDLNSNRTGHHKFVFDMRQLPSHVKNRLSELN